MLLRDGETARASSTWRGSSSHIPCQPHGELVSAMVISTPAPSMSGTRATALASRAASPRHDAGKTALGPPCSTTQSPAFSATRKSRLPCSLKSTSGSTESNRIADPAGTDATYPRNAFPLARPTDHDLHAAPHLGQYSPLDGLQSLLAEYRVELGWRVEAIALAADQEDKA
jgi:hypothetical protein